MQVASARATASTRPSFPPWRTGVRAAALLKVDNYVPERTEYEPHRDVVVARVERMIRVAVRAVPGLN